MDGLVTARAAVDNAVVVGWSQHKQSQEDPQQNGRQQSGSRHHVLGLKANEN